MDIELAAVLIAYIAVLTVFPWQDILFRRAPISWPSFRPTLLLSLSSLLQVVFIVLVARNVLTLDYSLRFAALGLPLCILALVLASRRKREHDVARGTVTCIILGLVTVDVSRHCSLDENGGLMAGSPVPTPSQLWLPSC